MQFLCGVAEVQGARHHHKAPELLEGDVHEVAASQVSITPTSCRRSTLTIAASGWSRFVPAGRAGEEVSTVRITVESLACPDIRVVRRCRFPSDEAVGANIVVSPVVSTRVGSFLAAAAQSAPQGQGLASVMLDDDDQMIGPTASRQRSVDELRDSLAEGPVLTSVLRHRDHQIGGAQTGFGFQAVSECTERRALVIQRPALLEDLDDYRIVGAIETEASVLQDDSSWFVLGDDLVAVAIGCGEVLEHDVLNNIGEAPEFVVAATTLGHVNVDQRHGGILSIRSEPSMSGHTDKCNSRAE